MGGARYGALPFAILTYSHCQIWENPTSARPVPAGPLLRDHPNARALMVCETRGQHWLFDFLDSADAGGEGQGRVICTPVEEAVQADACAALTTGDIDTLRPRLVVRDHPTAGFERVV